MSRELFEAEALVVAPQLLGATLTVESPAGRVTLRITEVEAYHGVGTSGPYDAGSHARDRRTERNAAMFGPPGHAYVYLSYGVHFALNLVCSPAGVASAVLIRAGDVVEGEALARTRRAARSPVPPGRDPGLMPHHALARGPGNLATALGITRAAHDGRDLFAWPFTFSPAPGLAPVSARAAGPASGPRVGVSGEAGGPAFPWRFWIPDSPTVSAFRPGRGAPR